METKPTCVSEDDAVAVSASERVRAIDRSKRLREWDSPPIPRPSRTSWLTFTLCVSPASSLRPQSATNAVKLLSTVPVINASGQCVGMLSMSDLSKGGKTVKDVMTSPAITVKRGNSVAEAAAVMLKYKVDALPVVDKDGAVVGAVSRTDMFTALESMEE